MVSFDRHNKEIRSSFCRKDGPRNSTVVNELINITFAMRRKDILDNNYHVHAILEKYPCFKEPSQVMEATQHYLTLWY